MKYASSLASLVAGAGFSLVAVALDIPKDPQFWQTLSNKQRVQVNCGKLAERQITVGFVLQYEPQDSAQAENMSPQQKAWLRMMRESRATDERTVKNIAIHLETEHGVKQAEIKSAHQHCLTLLP